jgi:hypothetical protein
VTKEAKGRTGLEGFGQPPFSHVLDDLAFWSASGHWNLGADGTNATDCDVDAPGQVRHAVCPHTDVVVDGCPFFQYANQGCSIQGAQFSMGPQFNSGGGGTYATEIDFSNRIAMW